MTIKSFPHGIPFSSSYAISASYAYFTNNSTSLSASSADFVTGFTGPTGDPAETTDNSGQFVIVPSESIEYVGSAYDLSGQVTFPAHQVGDLILVYGVAVGSYFAPILAVPGWNTLTYTAGPSTIWFYKFATSNSEQFPVFAANAPNVTYCVVYRNVDSIVNGGTSTGGNTVSGVTYPGPSPANFTPHRSHWLMYYVFASGPIPPRPGFVTRLSASGATVLFSDSNQVTGSVDSFFAGVSPNISFGASSYILRSKLDYSQFDS